MLNKDVIELPTTLSVLRASFKAATSFSHIQRLHNMLYFYGMTVVEVVRRKEFGTSLHHRETCKDSLILLAIHSTLLLSEGSKHIGDHG